MTRRGNRVRELSARMFSPMTMSRLIDPAITDMQTEYDEARRRGHTWRRRWVLIRGYLAFAQVVAQCGPFEIRQAIRDWNGADRHALSRVLWMGACAALLATILLHLLELSKVPDGYARSIDVAILLVPSTLSLSLPLGLAVGIAFGLSHRITSRPLVTAVLGIATVVSLAEVVNVAWVTPEANQAFRKEWARQSGWTGVVARGINELSLAELGGAPSKDTLPSSARNRNFFFHMRLSIALAPVTFAALALLLVAQRRPVRAVVTVCAVFVLFWMAAFAVRSPVKAGMITPAFAAWMPQLALVALITAMLAASRRHQSPFGGQNREEAPRWQ